MLVDILRYFLIFVEVLSSLLLIVVILLQRTRGQGMGLAFGAAMGESLFGAQVGNVLTRTTVVLATVFLVNTTILAVLGTKSVRTGSVVDHVQPTAAPVAAPGSMPSDMPVSAAPEAEFPMAAGGDAAAVPAPAEPVAAPDAAAVPAAGGGAEVPKP